MNYLTLLALLIGSNSYAGTSPYFKYGLGVFHSAEPRFTTVKTLALGVQFPLGPHLVQQIEAGAWTDTSGVDGRRGTLYGGWSAGIDVNAGYLNLQSLWGVAGITHTDSMLGGHFQFHQDLFLGLKDKQGRYIGANYSHFSSAGLSSPNLGRDLLSLKIGVMF